MKKFVPAAVALAGMSSAAFASDDILNGHHGSSLSLGDMATIQGEGGLTLVQTSQQSNSSTGTAGQVQQANQNTQQIGFENVAVNVLSQDQKIEVKPVTPTSTKPVYIPRPPKWWKR